MTSAHLTNLIDLSPAFANDGTNHIIRDIYLLRHLTARADNSSLDSVRSCTDCGTWNLSRILLENLSYWRCLLRLCSRLRSK